MTQFPTLSMFIHFGGWRLNQRNKTTKEDQGDTIWKEDKESLFVQDIIVYINDPKNSLQN